MLELAIKKESMSGLFENPRYLVKTQKGEFLCNNLMESYEIAIQNGFIYINDIEWEYDVQYHIKKYKSFTEYKKIKLICDKLKKIKKFKIYLENFNSLMN